MYRFFWFFFASLLLSANELAVHQLEARGVGRGEAVYKAYCAECHHAKRIGFVGPPLLPETLGRASTESLAKRIKNGFVGTLMPSYEQLSEEELLEVASFIKSKADGVVWQKPQIEGSFKLLKSAKADYKIGDFDNLTAVVERNGGEVWLMEDEKILTKFPVNHVHGGIKFSLDQKDMYIPSRDGKITKYSIENQSLYGEVRACVNMRNISLDKTGKKLFATCLLPETIEVFDASTLKHQKTLPLEGKISALYELYESDQAVFTVRNKPVIGLLDTNKLNIKLIGIDEPIEDFFIEPFERYMIATARNGSQMKAYDMQSYKSVFASDIEGMPHLFSATWWYKDGKFFFATPHLGKDFITIWQMYDWKLVTKVGVGGAGFFAKTHPATPYLWVDNGTDQLSFVDKGSFKIESIVPRKGKKFNHTEFSGDGKFSYLSIYENDGELVVLDTATKKEVVSYPAKLPVGKYNFINKNRVFAKKLFGEEVFRAKCWGCHHQSSEAFGPSFEQIASELSKGEMAAHIEDPKSSAKSRGLKRSLMPQLKLTDLELISVVEYIESFKDK